LPWSTFKEDKNTKQKQINKTLFYHP